MAFLLNGRNWRAQARSCAAGRRLLRSGPDNARREAAMRERITAALMAVLVAILVAVAAASWGGPAGAEEATGPGGKYDRHEGYYYPPLDAPPEIYKARAVTLPEADRTRRLAFVTAMTNQMMKNPYPPPFAIFAKGDNAEKLIIVSLYDNAYNTIYRARGLLAILTAAARTTEVFRNHRVEDIFTFFDLLKLQGFERVTITDGKRFAHQVRFE
jgi:hypothetical protein